MELFIQSFKKYYKAILKISLFLLAAMIVLYLFPREGKFRYEYAKGRPWKHGVLISDFDFPIYKTPDELKAEKDSVFKFFKPYFLFDTIVPSSEIELFKESFISRFPDLQRKYPFLKSGQRIKGQTLANYIKESIALRLAEIYQKGVILLPDEYHKEPSTFEFRLIKGNIIEPYELSEVYTPIMAYQKLLADVQTLFSDTLFFTKYATHAEIIALISQMDLNSYLPPNLKFDKQRTEYERQNLQKDISLTNGAIKAGQRIIATGEMVDDNLIKTIDSYKISFENRLGIGTGYSQIFIGQLLIVLSFFTGVYLFLFFFRYDIFANNKSVAFLLMMMVSMVFMARVSNSYFYVPIFVIPFAILPLTIRTFFDSRLALFIHIMTILMASFLAQNSFQFVFLQIPAGVTAIFGLYRIERRSQLVRASLFIVSVYALLYTALFLWQEGDIRKIDPTIYGKFFLNGVLLLFTYPAIYFFEKLFGFISDVTIAELSNSNHPLISKLAEETPGTFHHSIMVGNLAMEAAKKIGANPTLVYAGAMYHDIGKLDSPSIFSENQISGANPLKEVDYEKGAQMVIRHIENGIRLARKHKLPPQIIDFIATHQGTTKTKYFYHSFINKYPDKIPDISLFSYPGPTPFTKETAILMMADATEAASRSLTTFSDDNIDKLVESIIDDQMEQGQFINAPVTLKEITEVKEVFKHRLKIIYHQRIKYPEIDKVK